MKTHPLSDAVLRRLAGEYCFNRGHEYYVHGHVESMSAAAGRIDSVVRGSGNYAVSLSDDGLDYSCDCPQGDEGTFCKHCVATALAWRNGGSLPAKDRAKAKKVTLADAAKLLADEERETLVLMMVDWAKGDKQLRDRLLQYAARRSGPDVAVNAALSAFKAAVRVRGYIGYREARGWARGVDKAIDNIAQLLRDGHAFSVIELCESALGMLPEAQNSVDDSDGWLSSIRDRLQEIHFQACQEGKPDPVALAQRLFRQELLNELDIFYGAAETYAEILGATGLKQYRELADEEWKKVPDRTAKDKYENSHQYFAITHIMESLAKVSGDLSQRIAVMSRDLTYAYSYLKIGEVCREAGAHDQALDWAEQGLKAFPERTDTRLRQFAAGEYQRCNRPSEALTLMWAEFTERIDLASWKLLESHARRAGIWGEWRDRALAEVRRRTAKADRTLLAEIFLYEGDTEAAWREAQEGGCSDSMWLRLAGERAKDYPEDAVPIYLKQAETAVSRNSAYEESVGLLIKAAAVMKRMNRGEEFERTLDALSLKYKIKRNFIKLLAQNRQSLYLA